jgi:hypothetical protein
VFSTPAGGLLALADALQSNDCKKLDQGNLAEWNARDFLKRLEILTALSSDLPRCRSVEATGLPIRKGF